MKRLKQYFVIFLFSIINITNLLFVFAFSYDLFDVLTTDCTGGFNPTKGCYWGAESMGWVWGSPTIYLIHGLLIITIISLFTGLSMYKMIKKQYGKALLWSICPGILLIASLFALSF